MPEDAPGECVGEDADKVAAYIYESFYSKTAQARNKFQPPRIELSRLTVRQYKNAIADLLGSFQAPGSWDDQRGLKGDYSSRGQTQARQQQWRQLVESSRPRDSVSISERAARSPNKTRSKELAKSWQRFPCSWFPLSAFRRVLARFQG